MYTTCSELVPNGVVTSTLVAPALPGGVIAAIAVELRTVKLAAIAPPILTAVVPIKLVPVIVIDCPPVAGPDGGLIAITLGTKY